MSGLKPDYQTIARFRSEYKGAIKNDFSTIPTKTNMYAPKARDYDTLVKPSPVPGKEITRQPGKTAVYVLILALALPPETEEGLSAWQKNRSKSVLKICIIALRGKKYAACENRKWNYPLAT